MKSLAFRVAVALATFTAGVSLAALMFRSPAPRAVVEVVKYQVEGPPQFERLEIPSSCESVKGSKGKRDEAPEEKAVRLAEEFVARNGYTDLAPDRDGLSYETVEAASDVDEMLEWRRDSIERRAYGLRRSGKGSRSGWTVVFRYRSHYCDACDNVGRAVTMDGHFKNLRVEHQDFFLKAVEKKL